MQQLPFHSISFKKSITYPYLAHFLSYFSSSPTADWNATLLWLDGRLALRNFMGALRNLHSEPYRADRLWLGDTVKKVVELHRINNICQILWKAFKFGAEFC